MQKKINYEMLQFCVAAFLLVIVILSLSFFMTLHDRNLYDDNFTKNGVYDEIGVQGVRSTTDYLIKYLTSESTDDSGLVLFFPSERLHLKDVKKIILALKYLLVASIIGLVAISYFTKDKKEHIRKAFRYSGIATITLLAILIVLAFNFERFWLEFHKILFPQGNYEFSSNYLLIKLFPQKFFEAFTFRVILNAFLMSAALIGLSFAHKKIPKKAKQKN